MIRKIEKARHVLRIGPSTLSKVQEIVLDLDEFGARHLHVPSKLTAAESSEAFGNQSRR
jgi:hypothetical protein